MNPLVQFLYLVKDTIAADDPIVYDYILNWLVQVVQNIGEKLSVALVLIGTKGIGKTMFNNIINMHFFIFMLISYSF